jgi:hypothetical protein
MNKEEAIKYCYRHREQYIRDSDSISDGIRQFECLIAILEDGTIKPEDLSGYGMSYEN